MERRPNEPVRRRGILITVEDFRTGNQIIEIGSIGKHCHHESPGKKKKERRSTRYKPVHGTKILTQ
jgi:hypothetical protein